MALSATTIRTTIKGLLESAGIVASGRVHDTRSTPVADDGLASLGVYVVASDPTSRSLTSQAYKVAYKVAIQAVVFAADDAALGKAMDDVEYAILAATLAADSWQAAYEGVEWTSTEKVPDSDMNRRRGSVQVLLQVTAAESIEATGYLTFETAVLDTDLGTDKTPQTGWQTDVT